MKKVIRLTESDITRIVQRVINEREEKEYQCHFCQKIIDDWN